MKNVTTDSLRNIAIIAHVDHGKTTLVDQLLKQSGTVVEAANRVMDSGDIEKERGITILAKQTGISYKGKTINIVDTPGHSDFGGEVERTLQMVEGFMLLVDAAEGVLPGTRFVLRKALELDLKPIVLVNKIDRKDADIEATERLIQDLFLDLATREDQLVFPILYGSGRQGTASLDPAQGLTGDLTPLLDAIVEHVPAPQPEESHLQLLVTNLDHSDYLGQLAVGRIFSGSIKLNDQVVWVKDAKKSNPFRITKLYRFHGINRVEIEEACTGDIVVVAGFDQPVEIGATICHPENVIAHSYVAIDEPTLSMFVSVNSSPFSGREGNLLTSRQIKDRLEKETRTNVALQVEPTESPDTYKISGRGPLHLGILLENMRREGFEVQVSAPQVIYKTIDGEKCEPIEYLLVEVNQEHQGSVIERLGRKKAELKVLQNCSNDRIRMEFEIPSRGLFGFKSQFLIDTRGTGIANYQFLNYQPYKGDIPTRTKGALVSMEAGNATGFALNTLQERGTLFINPGDQVYEGLIIGEHSRDGDLHVNPCKAKKLSNMRASGTDEAVQLPPAKVMDLERCIEWINTDELIEITPKSIRLRKKSLKS
jgi:GTP-binding protein